MRTEILLGRRRWTSPSGRSTLQAVAARVRLFAKRRRFRSLVSSDREKCETGDACRSTTLLSRSRRSRFLRVPVRSWLPEDRRAAISIARRRRRTTMQYAVTRRTSEGDCLTGWSRRIRGIGSPTSRCRSFIPKKIIFLSENLMEMCRKPDENPAEGTRSGIS